MQAEDIIRLKYLNLFICLDLDFNGYKLLRQLEAAEIAQYTTYINSK